MNAEKFEHFVSCSLNVLLQTFDGVNPHSIVVLDNASIHHVDYVTETHMDDIAKPSEQ